MEILISFMFTLIQHHLQIFANILFSIFILYFLFRSKDVFLNVAIPEILFSCPQIFHAAQCGLIVFFFLPSDLLNVLTFWLCRHYTCLRQTNIFFKFACVLITTPLLRPYLFQHLAPISGELTTLAGGTLDGQE